MANPSGHQWWPTTKILNRIKTRFSVLFFFPSSVRTHKTPTKNHGFWAIFLFKFLNLANKRRACFLGHIYHNISHDGGQWMNRHILVSHFGHLASLVSAKLILGRFRDAVLPDFSRFPAGSDDSLNALFTDPRNGRYCGRYVPGA
jgi:hypothetical protein